ncbi:hypothetical protein DOM22_12585 [Bdellovibrio sp. ZAP7]|uniref:hypothetical protein n=1 Tax=Bdellovibrio sp. ZAP7 TaxID=2231053 RepID=UPI00115AB89D|nr:hypothetical protein [Bdellovibrio sp. ZAP7]QDK45928.1 hypothetical protein DOM22_12585 [Bdellovibrio sp. ZAP7]
MRNLNFAYITVMTSGMLLSACAPDVNFMTSQQNLASLDGGGGGVKFQSVSQSFEVKANSDIDVLFVVDNSGSMDAEQKGISAKINGFMNIIKDANWHVALTTTDPKVNTIAPDKSSRAWGDGQFRPFDSDSGSLFVLKAGQTSLTDAQKMLAAAVNVGLLGDGSERSINASYRAIERTANTPANQDFFREKSKLIVIAISDEDECSNGKCASAPEKSVPENLVKLVRERFGAEKVFMFNSIVKAPSDTACTTAAVAPIYEAMSKLTGGLIGSICATDYTSILSKMGTKTVELVKSINLNCQPVDANGDGDIDFSLIDSKGNKIAAGYSISGTTVSFAANLEEGSYSAAYSCVQ